MRHPGNAPRANLAHAVALNADCAARVGHSAGRHAGLAPARRIRCRGTRRHRRPTGRSRLALADPDLDATCRAPVCAGWDAHRPSPPNHLHHHRQVEKAGTALDARLDAPAGAPGAAHCHGHRVDRPNHTRIRRPHRSLADSLGRSQSRPARSSHPDRVGAQADVARGIAAARGGAALVRHPVAPSAGRHSSRTYALPVARPRHTASTAYHSPPRIPRRTRPRVVCALLVAIMPWKRASAPGQRRQPVTSRQRLSIAYGNGATGQS